MSYSEKKLILNKFFQILFIFSLQAELFVEAKLAELENNEDV